MWTVATHSSAAEPQPNKTQAKTPREMGVGGRVQITTPDPGLLKVSKQK
jgi:hypothetical protein